MMTTLIVRAGAIAALKPFDFGETMDGRLGRGWVANTGYAGPPDDPVRKASPPPLTTTPVGADSHTK
jgi:hypothetical protein